MRNIQGRYTTKQERIILSLFEENKGKHYTADEVCLSICEKGVSRATVYRRLERLVEDGVLAKFQIGVGSSACYRYCGRTEKTNSSHFVCTACNKVEHIDCEILPEISEHFEKGHGIKIDSKRTVFYGLCERCNADEK